MVLNLDFLTSDEHPTPNAAPETREGELCLRFRVPSGNEFAIPASGVREVMSVYLDRVTPIPNASPFFLGTYNWRGQVIWIADLGQFLGDGVLVNTDRNEVSLLIVEDRDLIMGFAVEEVANTEWLDVTLAIGDAKIPPAMSGFVKGVYATHDTANPELRLLDRVAILRSNNWAL
jgi:purine-binding chemotaxis protein CheW